MSFDSFSKDLIDATDSWDDMDVTSKVDNMSVIDVITSRIDNIGNYFAFISFLAHTEYSTASLKITRKMKIQ